MNYDPTHLDLFSGIGGFALAAQWAGFRTIAFCEIDKYCQKVLSKNFLSDTSSDRRTKREILSGFSAEIIPNIFDLDGTAYRGVSLLTGGFPCQPFSVAGKRRGAADDRAIWPEMFRVINEARPAWVLGENVPGIIKMELDNALSDLESIGYATRAFVIPACAVDAKHRRDRLWIVGRLVADGEREGLEGRIKETGGNGSLASGSNTVLADAGEQRLARCRLESKQQETTSGFRIADCCRWLPEPDVGRVAHGVSKRVDRLKGLGNAIVPQVAYEILRAIYREVIDSMHDSA